MHRGMWIVLDGHDCGMMIPDVTIPPAPNIAYPMFWPFSSRKPVFAASTVKMNGTPVACAQTVGFPPIPMMTCGDPTQRADRPHDDQLHEHRAGRDDLCGHRRRA